MMEWISPIYDRTLSDVEYAKQNPETVDDLKGSYNASDLNRVNNDMLYIQEVFHKMGYTISFKSATRVWTMTDVPTSADFDEYLSDVKTCRDKISVYFDTPGVPDYVAFNFTKANDIEKILRDVEELIRKIRAIYFYSGDIYSGEV